MDALPYDVRAPADIQNGSSVDRAVGLDGRAAKGTGPEAAGTVEGAGVRTTKDISDRNGRRSSSASEQDEKDERSSTTVWRSLVPSSMATVPAKDVVTCESRRRRRRMRTSRTASSSRTAATPAAAARAMRATGSSLPPVAVAADPAFDVGRGPKAVVSSQSARLRAQCETHPTRWRTARTSMSQCCRSFDPTK